MWMSKLPQSLVTSSPDDVGTTYMTMEEFETAVMSSLEQVSNIKILGYMHDYITKNPYGFRVRGGNIEANREWTVDGGYVYFKYVLRQEHVQVLRKVLDHLILEKTILKG